MKNLITRNTFLLIATIVMLVACDNFFRAQPATDENVSTGKAVCSFSVCLPESADETQSKSFNRYKLRLRAHPGEAQDDSGDVVVELLLSSGLASNVMAIDPGTYLFTGEILDSNTVVGYRGTVTQAIVAGENTISLPLLERSGDVRVSVTSSAPGLETVEISAVRGYSNAPMGVALDWIGSAETYLLNMAPGTWTVFALGRDADGNQYIGSADVEVVHGELAEVSIEIGSSPVSPQVVFLAAGSDVRSAVNSAWSDYLNGGDLRPVELRLASGTHYTNGIWSRNLISVSGGWLDATTKGGSGTTIVQSGLKQYQVYYAVGCSISDVTIDCGGVFEYLKVREGSALRVENVHFVNGGYDPSLLYTAEGRMIANISASSVWMDAVVADGGIKTSGDPNDAHVLHIANSSFEGKFKISQVPFEFDNVTIELAPDAEDLPSAAQSDWYGLYALTVYHVSRFEIHGSTVSATIADHNRAQLFVMAAQINEPPAGSSMSIEGSTFSASHTANQIGDYGTVACRINNILTDDVELNLTGNIFSVDAVPESDNDWAPENAVFCARMKNPPSEDLAISLVGNTFRNSASLDPSGTYPGQWLVVFYRDWQSEDPVDPPPCRPTVFTDNVFEYNLSAASKINLMDICNSGTFDEVISSQEQLNDPSLTTWGGAASASNNVDQHDEDLVAGDLRGTWNSSIGYSFVISRTALSVPNTCFANIVFVDNADHIFVVQWTEYEPEYQGQYQKFTWTEADDGGYDFVVSGCSSSTDGALADTTVAYNVHVYH